MSPSMTCCCCVLLMHGNLTFCAKQSYFIVFFFCVRDYGPISSAETEMLSFMKDMFFPKLYLPVLMRSWSQTFGPHCIYRTCEYM